MQYLRGPPQSSEAVAWQVIVPVCIDAFCSTASIATLVQTWKPGSQLRLRTATLQLACIAETKPTLAPGALP